MLPYFLIFTLSLTCFSISQYLTKNQQVGARFFILIGMTMLVCLAAYRSHSVGTDTSTYLAMWNNFNYSNQPNENWLFSEPLFGFLQYITKFITNETLLGQELFLGSISLIVCSFTFLAIMHDSKNKFLSLFIFLFLGFYTFHFNGARQAIAIALFLYSIKYILNGNAKKYVLIVCVGFLFHKSMLITAPFYYLYRREFTPRIVLLIVVSTIFAAISITSIVEFASEFDSRYKSYADSSFAGGGLVQTLFFTIILFWLFLTKKINRINDKLYDISLLSMLISVCISWLSIALSLNPSGILRLTSYFTQFMIFSLPVSLFSFSRSTTRGIVLTFFLFFSLIYFYLTTSSFSGLSPYRLGIELPFKV